MSVGTQNDPDAATPPRGRALRGEAERGLLDRRWLQRLIVWGAMAALYEVAAIVAGPFFLPRVSAIGEGIVQLVTAGHLATIGGSLQQMLIGFGLALAVGIPVGMAMGASKFLDYILGMYINAMFVTSLVALLPLLIVIVGVDLQFRVTVVFLFSVFFIILNTASGVRDVDRALIGTARAFMASRFRLFFSVRFPASLPFIVAGARLGLANAFSGMILAELWVTRDTGLLLTLLGLNRDLPRFFAIVLLVTLLAAASATALKAAERRFVPWGSESHD